MLCGIAFNSNNLGSAPPYKNLLAPLTPLLVKALLRLRALILRMHLKVAISIWPYKGVSLVARNCTPIESYYKS